MFPSQQIWNLPGQDLDPRQGTLWWIPDGSMLVGFGLVAYQCQVVFVLFFPERPLEKIWSVLSLTAGIGE